MAGTLGLVKTQSAADDRRDQSPAPWYRAGKTGVGVAVASAALALLGSLSWVGWRGPAAAAAPTLPQGTIAAGAPG